MIRFHLDQHVANAVAVGLRLRGIDVSTTHEAGLQEAEDSAHIAYALAEGRVIFTQDDDFVRHHHAGVHHAGKDGLLLTVYVDDQAFSWDNFGKKLCTYAGWGMRIVFVPDDELESAPKVVVRESGD